MAKFAPIEKRALKRAGGADKLEALMPVPKTADELTAMSDDRYLSDMCRRVFRAGLRYSMVDNKWPAFEEVFHGFVPRRITLMDDEEMEACMSNTAIIRHWSKISSVRANAAAMQQVIRDHGSFGQWLADWPGDDVMGLWDRLAKNFQQLGGNSGPYFLRMVGKDSFVFTGDVVQGLIDNGVVEKKPTARGDRKKARDTFNAWSRESGRPLCQISRILALSVD